MIRALRSWSTLQRVPPSFQCLRHPVGQTSTFATISTLNHELFDFVNQPIANVSGLVPARLSIYFTPTSIRPTKLYYTSDRGAPFPPNTRGYFYYLPDPRFPLVDGALRFRILPPDTTDDYPDFAAPGAEDLRTPEGTVWERTLYALQRRKDSTLLEKLRAEKLVHPDAKEVHRAYVKAHNRKERALALLADPGLSARERVWAEKRAAAVLENREHLPRRPKPSTAAAASSEGPRAYKAREPRPSWLWPTESRVATEKCRLYSQDDVFEIDLSKTCVYFHIGEPDTDNDASLDLYYVFRDKRDMYTRESSHGVAPYQGKILARFELASFLDSKRKLRDYIVLRVVEITEPIIPLVEDYDGYVHRPVVGQLLGRGLKKEEEADDATLNPMLLWKLPLESPRGAKLRPLFM